MRDNIIHMYPKADVPLEVFEWFIRIEEGKLSPEDIAELKTWIKENPERAVYFPDLDHIWAELGTVTVEHKPKTTRPLSYSGWWSTRKYIAVAATVLIAFLAAWPFIPNGAQGDVKYFETATGERHIATLSDGSSLHMNAQTRITVTYTADERHILLQQGEAYFDVAKNPARPFIVRSGDLSVRALGTVFNVEHIVGQKSAVTLIEGAIQVAQLKENLTQSSTVLNQKGAKATLIEGVATSDAVARNITGITLQQVNADNVISWRDGQLIFAGESLSQAIYKLNMHTNHKIILQDAKIGQEPIYGIFSMGDWKSAVRAIVKSYALEKIEEGPTKTVLGMQRRDPDNESN